MMNLRQRAGIVILCSGLAANFVFAADYYVSVGGSDSNPGTRESPLASAAGARDLIRKSGRAGKEAITVNFLPGSYYLGVTLTFKPEDSGSDKAPVTYQSTEEGQAVLSGGRKLALTWVPWKDGIMKAETPAGLSVDQLFVNGSRQVMARYPNYDPNVVTYNGFAADAFSKERAARWKNPAGGYIHAMHAHHWGGYHYRITGKNEKGEVTYEGGWQNNRQMGMHPVERFVENVFEELDAPGEWYHDSAANTLYYYPPKDVDLGKATVEVVLLSELVDFAGSAATPVKWITLSGFTFRHSARTFMSNKEPLLRSDWTIYRGGEVTLTGASDCTWADCVFDQPGANAVFVNKWNRRVTVKGCLFTDVGASGVAFVGDPGSVRNPLFEYNQRLNYTAIDKTPGPKTDDYPSDCLVEDCLMARTGRIEKQGAGVHLSMAHKVTVRHCTIYDTSRSGININEGTFGGHVIEFCDVFDTVKETGDHGSFNSWGRDRYWGLQGAPEAELTGLARLDIMEPNIIRNSRWRCDRGWDVDLDDGSSYYEIYNNLFLHGGLKLREGFCRKAYNNIMVNNSLHPHVWFKDSGDVFTNNIVMGAYRPAAMNNNIKWGKEVDYNIFTTSDKDRTHFAARGCDEHSIVAEVKFVDPKNGDYRVKDECKAVFAIGFKNFPMDEFGVTKKSLKAIARHPVLPESAAAEPKTQTKVAAKAPVAEKNEYTWQGAKVKPLEGEEFSAYGVSKEDGGVCVVDVPATSMAAAMGLKPADLVQKINGEKVKDVKALLLRTNAAGGKPLSIGIVRGQQGQTLTADKYIYSEVESSATSEFKTLALKKSGECAVFKAVTANGHTANDPLGILNDGKLAQGYGPVFPNGVADGIYKVELEDAGNIKSISTWAYRQGGPRADMNFTLYGSGAADPGWDLKKCEAIADVVAGLSHGSEYLGARVEENKGGSLGRYRWLLWKVSPVNGTGENTAFQEFQVEMVK